MGKFPIYLFVPILKWSLVHPIHPALHISLTNRNFLPTASFCFSSKTVVASGPEDGYDESGGEGCAAPSGTTPAHH